MQILCGAPKAERGADGCAEPVVATALEPQATRRVEARGGGVQAELDRSRASLEAQPTIDDQPQFLGRDRIARQRQGLTHGLWSQRSEARCGARARDERERERRDVRTMAGMHGAHSIACLSGLGGHLPTGGSSNMATAKQNRMHLL